MLEVKVIRTVTHPEYQRFTSIVRMGGFDKLTPHAARAALQTAFGQPYGGEVWGPDGFGYRVYPKSVRKLHDWMYNVR